MQLGAQTLVVARTISTRRRISSNAMELISGHESFLALSNRGALSILNARFKFARWSYLVSGQPFAIAEASLCLFRSDWSLLRLDVCICNDASERFFSFAIREGQEKLTVRSREVQCAESDSP